MVRVPFKTSCSCSIEFNASSFHQMFSFADPQYIYMAILADLISLQLSQYIVVKAETRRCLDSGGGTMKWDDSTERCLTG